MKTLKQEAPIAAVLQRTEMVFRMITSLLSFCQIPLLIGNFLCGFLYREAADDSK